MDLDSVRFKDIGELSDEEKGFLKENEANLIDEEKEIFKSVLHPEEFTPTPTEGESSVPPEAPPAVPEPPVTPEAPTGLNFKNEEDLNAYLEKRDKDKADQAAAAEAERIRLEEVEKNKTYKFFEEGYKPQDWNEFANVFMKVAVPVITQEVQNLSGSERAKLEQRTAEINDAYDKETELLRTTNTTVPAKIR